MAERRRARPSRDWPVDPDLLDDSRRRARPLLYGADAVHRQLVRWLERCGARRLTTPQDLDEAARANAGEWRMTQHKSPSDTAT